MRAEGYRMKNTHRSGTIAAHRVCQAVMGSWSDCVRRFLSDGSRGVWGKVSRAVADSRHGPGDHFPDHAAETELLSSPRPSADPDQEKISSIRLCPVGVSPFGTCCVTKGSLGHMSSRRFGVSPGFALLLTSTRTAFASPVPAYLSTR